MRRIKGGKNMKWNNSFIHRIFTLIELLIVIAIISILASLLLPALAKSRELAKQTICAGNLKQIGIGIYLYLDSNNGWFPDYMTPIGGTGMGWGEAIKDFVGKEEVFYGCPSYDDKNFPPAFYWTSCSYGYNYWYLGRHSYGTFRKLSQIKFTSKIILCSDSDGDLNSSPPGKSKIRVYKPPSDSGVFSQ
jgi:prepilin-type N-terminal cleavage/methylation domain-containing protein